MKKPVLITIVTAIIVCAVYTKSYTYSAGPPAGNVNIKGVNCSQAGCHSGTKLNAGGGNVVISLVGQKKPWVYHIDSTYIINVIVTDTKAKKFGFEAAVVDNTLSFSQIGTTSSYGTHTTTTTSSGVTYAEQSKADTLRHFQIKWKAPSSGTGIARVFACGNGADGNGGSSGDHIYAVVDTIRYKPFSTEIDNVEAAKPLLYYNSNKLLVKIPAANNVLHTLRIYDMNGRLVSANTVASDMEISTATLAPGLYIAALSNREGITSTRKFVKN